MIEVFLFGIVLGLIPVTLFIFYIIRNCVFTIEAWRSVGPLIN